MYQGNNPIAIKSQHMMLDALNELLKEKDYKDISISEICDRSTISRQTFYKLFGSKNNLLLFKLKNAPFADQHKETDETSLTLMDICERFSSYVATNYSQFQMLLENDLMEVLYTQIYTSMYSCRISFMDLDDNEREYASQFIAAGLCRLTQKYIREHEKPDHKELTEISYKIMSGSIYRRK